MGHYRHLLSSAFRVISEIVDIKSSTHDRRTSFMLISADAEIFSELQCFSITFVHSKMLIGHKEKFISPSDRCNATLPFNNTVAYCDTHAMHARSPTLSCEISGGVKNMLYDIHICVKSNFTIPIHLSLIQPN